MEQAEKIETEEVAENPNEDKLVLELDNDDGFDLSALENLDIEALSEEQSDEPEEDLEDDDDPDEADEEEQEEPDEEEPEAEEQPKKRKSANSRIQELTNKLKEKDDKLDALERKFDNLQQGIDYLKPKDDAAPVELDDQLSQAAIAAGDREFDLDEFTTDAEKKTALRAYKNDITLRQQEDAQAVNSVRQQYSQAVDYYKEQDPEIGAALTTAYNAAVRDEARAIMRRYPNLQPNEAVNHAEKALLNEARQAQDPVMFIASFGKQILDDAQQLNGGSKQKLTKPKENGKIDHKNRETVRRKAGKPEVETAPLTKRQQQVNETWQKVSSEW
jgi:hypothetical protein